MGDRRGAKIILVRPAPVPGFRGPRSFALPEFDPFWELVQEKDLVVGMHASDSGYQRYVNEWEGIARRVHALRRGGGLRRHHPLWPVHHRHRRLGDRPRVVHAVPPPEDHPVENGSGWVRPLLHDMAGAYSFNPHLFEEDPVEVFERCIFVHPFHEDDPVGLCTGGADNVLFGSDYPHPEGMSDPLGSSTTSTASRRRTPPRSWAATSPSHERARSPQR